MVMLRSITALLLALATQSATAAPSLRQACGSPGVTTGASPKCGTSAASALFSDVPASAALSNGQLTSPNGNYVVKTSPTGFVATYQGVLSTANVNDPFWPPAPTDQVLTMQSDGDLVFTSSSGTPGWGAQRWHSNTAGAGSGPYCVVLQDSGVLELFDATGTSLWTADFHTDAGATPNQPVVTGASATCGTSAASALFSDVPAHSTLYTNDKLTSPDGSFVISMTDTAIIGLQGGSNVGSVLFSAATTDRYLVMQQDGNVAMYNPTAAPRFSTNTFGKGKGPYCLVINNAGRLAIIDSTDAELWGYTFGV